VENQTAKRCKFWWRSNIFSLAKGSSAVDFWAIYLGKKQQVFIQLNHLLQRVLA